MIRSISNKRTRSDRATRHRVADAVINSRLFFGVELTCRAFEDMVQTLSTTYNNTIRALSGLLPSTPAHAACVEAGVLPFQYKAVMAICCRAVGYLERTKDDGQVCFLEEQANRALYTVARTKLPPVAGLHFVGPRKWRAEKTRIDNTLKSRFRKGSNPLQVQTWFRQRIHERYTNTVVRYTDGSKLANRVGVGVHGINLNLSHRLPDQCSVFSAEAAAIFLATAEPSDDPILVVTDSASALSAIESSTNKHPFIQATQNVLDNYNGRITFMWVPGHCGVPGNERADRLADIGRQKRLLTKKIPGDDAKSYIKTIIWEAWATQWSRERNLFIRRIKADVLPWVDVPNWKEQKVLSRLRTGHTRSSHNMGSGDFRKICETCNTRNTVEHFISNCPNFEDLRRLHGMSSTSRALQNDPAQERTTLNFLKEAQLINEI